MLDSGLHLSCVMTSVAMEPITSSLATVSAFPMCWRVHKIKIWHVHEISHGIVHTVFGVVQAAAELAGGGLQ